MMTLKRAQYWYDRIDSYLEMETKKHFEPKTKLGKWLTLKFPIFFSFNPSALDLLEFKVFHRTHKLLIRIYIKYIEPAEKRRSLYINGNDTYKNY